MRYNGFKGRTSIVSTHAKQDGKIQSISSRLYAMDMNDEKIFIVTKKQYQFLNMLEEHLKFLSTRQKKQAKTSSISLRCDGNSYGRLFESDDLY